jgi:hypothetical protein
MKARDNDKVGLLNNSLSLAAALGVTKFMTAIPMDKYS